MNISEFFNRTRETIETKYFVSIGPERPGTKFSINMPNLKSRIKTSKESAIRFYLSPEGNRKIKLNSHKLSGKICLNTVRISSLRPTSVEIVKSECDNVSNYIRKYNISVEIIKQDTNNPNLHKNKIKTFKDQKKKQFITEAKKIQTLASQLIKSKYKLYSPIFYIDKNEFEITVEDFMDGETNSIQIYNWDITRFSDKEYEKLFNSDDGAKLFTRTYNSLIRDLKSKTKHKIYDDGDNSDGVIYIKYNKNAQ